MLSNVEECEQMLSLLSIRDFLAEVAEGDIEASYMIKQSALIMCSNFDLIFGVEQLYYNGLEKDIYSKLNQLRKDRKELLKPINNLLNTLKSWDE